MSGGFRVEQMAEAGDLAGHLFVDPAFLAYQSRAQDKQLTTFAAVGADGATAASLTLAGREGVWTSPVTGAFGGLAASARAPADCVFEIVDAATRWLADTGAKTGVVRLAPDVFADPTAAALENALVRRGWRLAEADINFHLPVTAPDLFLRGLSETKQKEVRRLQRSGAGFRRLAPGEGRLAYQVIADNRAARNYPMTMTWPQVEALAAALPAEVSFWVAERGADILAGAICLRLTPAYAYVFYWGEAPAFRKESPVLLLAEGLVAEHHRQGAAILDLGISTAQSAPNPGLIAFKEGLGCRASGKRTYVLER
jgi:hypothetical protein